MARVRTNLPARGFTLSELLVSIAILGIIGGMLIANFSRGRLTDELRNSSQALASNLRLVQNAATIGEAISVDGNRKVPPGGYGITIPWQTNQNAYTMFADVKNKKSDGTCDQTTNSTNANSEYDVGCDLFAEAGTVQFKPNVVLNAIKIDSLLPIHFGDLNWSGPLNGNGNVVDITFKPPKPVPVLDGDPGHTIQLELYHLKSRQYRTIIIVGPSGQVSERAGAIQ